MDDPVDVLIECVQAPCAPHEIFSNLAYEPYPFFLDSATTHSGIGNYSLLGARPFLIFQSKGYQVQRIWRDRIERFHSDPWLALQKTLQIFERVPGDGLPFVGGAVGYFAYDLGRFIEKLPQYARDDLHLPECWLAFYGACYIFDHQTQNLYLVAHNQDAPRQRQVTEKRLRWLKAKLSGASAPSGGRVQGTSDITFHRSSRLRSNFSRDAYMQATERVQEYIAAGDIYQANLSQRFHTKWDGDPTRLYARLRESNPAPFAAYLDTGECVVLSSSPERFLKLDPQTRMVETRPIKGTRPRGKTPEEDTALADVLFHSPKDRAELLMIVDLERNDLGRVSEIGSVSVPSLFRLESYATVHHLVSTVTGKLAAEYDTVDLLRATFPGGSITGAPKIRAMEIIEELEPTWRHIYTGAIGYLSFSGDMDLNIAIRTILLKGEDVYFQLGGGIVADSDPVMEYEETLHKGKALLEIFQ